MPLKNWLDRRHEQRRRRDMSENPQVEWDPDAGKLLHEDGLDVHWRIHNGVAHGRRLDGEVATIPADRFAERYLRPR